MLHIKGKRSTEDREWIAYLIITVFLSLLLIFSIYSFISNKYKPIPEVETTNAVITDVSIGRLRPNSHPVYTEVIDIDYIAKIEYIVNDVRFENSMWYSSEPKIGDGITIKYYKDNPQNLFYGDNNFEYSFLTIISGLFTIFFAIVTIINHKEAKIKKQLKNAR
ncbi:MAG: DUF3592 domain-containing protein [Clostridiales bacterium]|jgi:hypothetical protein|nr:DUF3592 domain-containing protein [Clostridiales bacterium]